jgi:hypothetical protein
MYSFIDSSSYYETIPLYIFTTYIVCIIVLEIITQIQHSLRQHLSIHKPLN